jgi:hypothetical protein
VTHRSPRSEDFDHRQGRTERVASGSYVRRRGACIRRRGCVGSGAWPVGKRASAAACGRGSLRVRGVQRLDEALRPF